MKGKGKQDFSSSPAVVSSLADKLRAKGLAPPAPPARTPVEEAVMHNASSTTGVSPSAGVSVAGPLSGCGKVVVRMERKGHGGKTVTVVDGLTPLDARLREALARRLAKGLGCGARAEGLTVVLQGDHRERAESLLRAEGARRVVTA